MFSLHIDFHFDAGHRIWNHDLRKGAGSVFLSDTTDSKELYKCSNPHGHTFYVSLEFQGENLDAQGMLIDTHAIKIIIQDFLHQHDHTYILHQDDPLAQDFIRLFSEDNIILISQMPTAEGLAEYIYSFFSSRLAVVKDYSFTLARVFIRISHTISATFSVSRGSGHE